MRKLFSYFPSPFHGSWVETLIIFIKSISVCWLARETFSLAGSCGSVFRVGFPNSLGSNKEAAMTFQVSEWNWNRNSKLLRNFVFMTGNFWVFINSLVRSIKKLLDIHVFLLKRTKNCNEVISVSLFSHYRHLVLIKTQDRNKNQGQLGDYRHLGIESWHW